MFKTLLIDSDPCICNLISSTILQYCSGVEFLGMYSDIECAPIDELASPDLIFWGCPESLFQSGFLPSSIGDQVQHILLVKEEDRSQLLQGHPLPHIAIDGYLNIPIQVPDLLITLSHASAHSELKKALHQQQLLLDKLLNRSQQPEMIGIPTSKGTEFFPASEILRCEGKQKYTMVHTTQNDKVMSSYNIGEFGKLLLPNGFYSPHRSHLINLRHVKKLTCENQIILKDGTAIPLSRRRKVDFIKQFRPEGCFH